MLKKVVTILLIFTLCTYADLPFICVSNASLQQNNKKHVEKDVEYAKQREEKDAKKPLGKDMGENVETPRISSESAMLMDAKSGQVLFSKNEELPMSPANAVKLMTALVYLENAKIDDMVTISESAVSSFAKGAANIGLIEGEKVLGRDLLYAMLIGNANDCAIALSEHISRSQDDFIKLLNRRALSLSMKNTNFTNAYGIDEKDNYVTAYDLSLCAKELMKNANFRQIISKVSHDIDPTEKQKEKRSIETKNQLIRKSSKFYNADVIGSNIVYSASSNHCIVTFASRDDDEFICVLLNSPNADDKYIDTNALLDYAFSGFNLAKIDLSLIYALCDSVYTSEDTVVNRDQFEPIYVNLTSSQDISDVYGVADKNNSRIDFCIDSEGEQVKIASLSVKTTQFTQKQELHSEIPGYVKGLFIMLCVVLAATVILFMYRSYNIRKRRKRRRR